MLSRGLIPSPASGALKSWKGDGQDENWLVEYKLTEASQYILKLETWKKVENEAFCSGKRPRLEIEFKGRKYLVVLDRDDFDELIGGK